MAPRRGRTALAATAVLLALGGYAAADAQDVVPGVLTLEPAPPRPAPFPQPPGAQAGGTVGETLADLSADAPLPDAAQIQALIDGLAADPRVGPSVGVVVADALTGERLGALDPQGPHTPASTAKLLTALAGLTSPGGDATLSTRVVQGEGGGVVLVGGGDMMLAAGAGSPELVNGRAGLADLARQTAAQLALAGVREVSLAVDDSLFSGPAVHPAWSSPDPQGIYAAPVAALAVDIARTAEGAYVPRHADPAMHAAQVFATALATEGVSVAEPVTRAVAPPEARVLGAVESAPLREVIGYLLQTSDNTIAEVVGRTVAVSTGLPGSFEGATTAVLATAERLGLPSRGARLADCSGLAEGSTVTVELLASVVLALVSPEHPGYRSAAIGLPIAGYTGTLADRYAQSPARGLLRAKTGGLPGVTGLAGTVLTPDDRLLVFAVLADRTPAGGQWGPRAAIDGFASGLSRTGGAGTRPSPAG